MNKLGAVVLGALLMAMGSGNAFAQNKRITGKVIDTSGSPLVGATVQIQNTYVGTVTNADGLFVIDAAADDILSVTYIGYLTQQVPVGGRDNVNITLEPDTQMFEEVVVVGYGTQRKGGVVSSVSSVTTKELMSPNANLTRSLAGQMAGLISVSRSSEPGRDDAEFWIRGVSTYQGGTDPLILVDGIPRQIRDIEPDEIETFTLLKDAAATAVYGAEGANGVILVTTKRGIISKPKITFRAEYAISNPQRVPGLVNSWEYLELVNEALFNDGLDPYKTAEEIEKYRSGEDRDLYPNSNWMDMLDKNIGSQRYTLGFRGGAENARYFVQLGFIDQDGVFKKNKNSTYDGDYGYQRYNLRSNIDLRVTKTTDLAVNLAAQYMYKKWSNRSADDIFSFMLHTPSYMFPDVYSDGTLSTYPVQTDSNNRNPYNMLYEQGYRKEYLPRMQADINLIQDLNFVTPGLSFNAKVGLDFESNMRSLRDHAPKLYNASGRDNDGDLIFNSISNGTGWQPPSSGPVNGSTYRNTYIEAQFNYQRIFAEVHRFTAMILYNQKENHVYSQALPYRKQGIVGRTTYSYDDRYFIEANFGYTGSDNFAKNHRWGFFPAVGASYLVSREKFYPEALRNIVNSFKIRGSYGKTGNDKTQFRNGKEQRFAFLPEFNSEGYEFSQGFGSGGALKNDPLGKGVYDVFFRNDNLLWEIEYKRNFGLDLAFLGNKIDLSVDYFNNLRTNIITQRQTIPSSAGFHQDPFQNWGKVKNWGTDMSLNVHHSFGDFRVSARGTFTFARNKIVEIDELPQEWDYQRQTGRRIGDMRLLVAERLYTEDDFIRTQKGNGTYIYTLKPGLPNVELGKNIGPGPGDIKYADLNGDGVINADDMAYGYGNPYTPEINYGFGINVDYKGFYISAFFQGTGNTSIDLTDLNDKTKRLAGNNTFFPFNWGYEKANYRTEFLDRWTADDPRQDVFMPRLHTGYETNNSAVPSTWWLKNGSFMRLKNLEVGYVFPKKLTEKINMDYVRVYAMGYNVFLWDNFGLWDPEHGIRNKGNSYPSSRTFTFGVEFNF